MRRGLTLGVLAALLCAAPAAATHDADDHSDNAQLVGSTKLGGLGDIAFWDDTAVVSQFLFEDGSTDGFSVVDVSNPTQPRETSRFVCSGSGWDVSIHEHLVFLSNDDFTPTLDSSCGASPGPGFYGLKIVSIADPAKPVQVGAVQSPCGGSHTNTVVPFGDRLIVYTSSLRYSSEPGLSGCDMIVEVPIDAPDQAKIVGALPGDAVQNCHDVTVFLPRKLLAAACFEEFRFYDIADPRSPVLLSHASIPGDMGIHSAAFSNDGNTVVFGEESAFYSGGTSACPGGTPIPVGGLWFYDVSDPTVPVPQSYHQVPRGTEAPMQYTNGCSAHDFNVVPTRGDQDILVTAWYGAGLSVIDFTDPVAPKEIAHYRPDAADEARRPHYWSAYWYRDHVFATNTYESQRQTLDVFTIRDGRIGPAFRLPHLNPQSQEALVDAPAKAPVGAGAGGPAGSKPAPCKPSAKRLRVKGARKVLRAQLLGAGRPRRLPVRGRVVRVNLRGVRAGAYTVRVSYKDRRGRKRLVRRTVTSCG